MYKPFCEDETTDQTLGRLSATSHCNIHVLWENSKAGKVKWTSPLEKMDRELRFVHGLHAGPAHWQSGPCPGQIVTPLNFNKPSSFDMTVTTVIIPCQYSGARNAAGMHSARMGLRPADPWVPKATGYVYGPCVYSILIHLMALCAVGAHMKSPSSRYRAALLMSLLLVTTHSQVWGLESQSITSVQVAPDFKQISIGCDGPVGKLSSFVLKKPYRIVLDMESTGLGNVPTKINVGGNFINEIRLGHENSRARVVVDFGDRPTPSFTLHRQNNVLLVSLKPKVGALQPRPSAKPAAQPLTDPVQPKAVVSAPAYPEAPSSKVSVKTAGVKDNLVFVELASKKDPKRTVPSGDRFGCGGAADSAG